MGEATSARQTQWDADVALKVLTDQILADPLNRHRIAREAEAGADLSGSIPTLPTAITPNCSTNSSCW